MVMEIAITTTACLQPTGYVIDSQDCNDIDPLINPAADEYCDEIDQDCDGDSYDPEALDPLTWHVDADEDGFGDPALPIYACLQPAGTVENSDDCDDSDDLVFPFSHETEVPFVELIKTAWL